MNEHVGSTRMETQRPVLPIAADFLERYVVVMTLVAMVVVFSVAKPDSFFTVANLQSMLATQAALLILACCLTVVLASGELDLSIGGVLGFTGVFGAWLSAVKGLSVPATLVLTLLAALAIGGFNAFMIVKIRVNALIATLAMGTLLTGVSSAISDSSTIAGVASGYTKLFSGSLLGIGLPFWYAVVVGVVLWYVMNHTPSGRFLYFTGEGREAARLIGVRVTRIRVVALLVSSLGAWLAGLIVLGQAGAAQAGFGDSYLLPAYAATFLGAATIRPGRFNPIGTFAGALLLAVGTTGLQLFGLDTWVTSVFDGAILILAVGAAAVFGNRARA